MVTTKPNLFVQRAVIITVCCLSLWIGGCGDFFAEKPTEIESQRIRDDVGDIRAVPDANMYIPYIYRTPPSIVEQVVGGQTEFKLLYFCKQHSCEELAKMVKEQFSEKIFDKKGRETILPHYTITTNPATNQIVARCPTRQDVDAVLELVELMDVPPIQVRIDCLISEIYADKTLDWETTIEIGDLLGEDISAGGSARLWGTDVIDLLQEETPLPAFPGASLREVARAKMGLKVGYISTEHDFLAVVDLLESKGYLKVVMNPTLEVVNGKKARIQALEHVPLEQVYLRDREGFVESRTEYVDVIDSLEITPHVFADGYIGLETTALIGSKNIPEGVKQIRIVSKREIYNEENRIRQGQSLVIGGIRKSEEHSVVRGVPFLKDIPVLGVLFSSKDYEERGIETVFILTPTISSGGVPNIEMVENLQRKHAPATEPQELGNVISDPFGLHQREEEYTQKLHRLEQKYYEIESEREKARRAIQDAQINTETAIGDAEEAKAKAAEYEAKLEELKAETEKVRQELEKVRAEAEAARKQAEEAKKQAKADKKQAEEAKKQAEAAQKQAEAAKKEAAKKEEEAAKAEEREKAEEG